MVTYKTSAVRALKVAGIGDLNMNGTLAAITALASVNGQHGITVSSRILNDQEVFSCG
jgi:hypothetical protein